MALETEKSIKLPFFSVVQEIFKCPLCNQIYKDPVQTSCGHRFCEECFNTAIRDKQARCPVDEQMLSMKEVIQDTEVSKQLATTMVSCPLSDKGCHWSGPVHKLEDHNRECVYQDILCPKGCGNKVKRKELRRHVASSDCSITLTRCKMCFMEVTVDRIKHHQCPYAGVSSPEATETNKVGISKMNAHRYDINGNLGAMKFPLRREDESRSFTGATTDSQKASKEYTNKAGNSLSTARAMLKDTESKLQQQNETIKRLQETLYQQFMLMNASEEKQNLMQQKIDNQDFVVEEQDKRLARLEKEVENLSLELASCRSEVSELKNGSQNGTLLWRIDNFSGLLDNALNRKSSSVFSPSIYTSKYGYKLCAQLFPGGTGDSFGHYVSIYFHLMATDHDDVLKWPFSHKITFTLLDQVESGQDGQNVSYTLTPAPGAPNYQKPSTDVSEGRGYHKFISHEKLRQGSYIKNDTIFIKIKVNGKNKE